MKKWLLRCILLIVFICMVLILTVAVLPTYLTYQKPVESENLLIESWISSYEIEQAIQVYKKKVNIYYYLTGVNYPDDLISHKSDPGKTKKVRIFEWGVPLFTNGMLNVIIPGSINSVISDSTEIELTLAGKGAEGIGAHFNVVYAGNVLGGGFAEKEPKVFRYKIPMLRIQENLILVFNNDLATINSDRNLYLIELLINGKVLDLNQQNLQLLEVKSLQSTGFLSQAHEMADYLRALGVNPSQISVVPFEKVERNQTLASAKVFLDKGEKDEIKSLNILTSGMHSRRTFVTYRHILPNEIALGVLYFESPAVYLQMHEHPLNWYLYLLNEGLAFLVNWVQLKFS